MTQQGPIRIGVVGAQWRAQYFLRIARALPERWTVGGMLVRTDTSATEARAAWGIPATTSFDEFLASGPYDFVVVSVPVDQAGDLSRQLAGAGVPVLLETPPAPTLGELESLYRDLSGAPVQVAEQYRFQPHHAARLSVARSGILGDVTGAHLSVAHGYHGVSLIRFALGVGFEPVRISAWSITDRVVSARGRDAWNSEYVEYDSATTLALFDFHGKTSTFEFNGEQYFSPIRSRHIAIRGTRGELRNDEVDYLTEPGFAAHERLYREETGRDGDLEGSFLRRISLRDTEHWSNRFTPARLNDDELAVAEVMHRMSRFVRSGHPFYSLADASHDQYLSLLMDESVASGQPVDSARMPWDSESSSCVTRGDDD
ncbi:MAG: Gfo/Idh/MocA family oxidoreductase [Rhodoglobus sp.]|nr:Gfo/Idh/MocA family oxidoreductase [Rhodoglobus sp.]